MWRLKRLVCLDFDGNSIENDNFLVICNTFVTGMKINMKLNWFFFYISRNGAATVWGQRFLYQRI